MSLLIVGADHGGYQLKEELKKAAAELNWLVKDVGTHGTDPVDYPDIAHKVALEVVATPGSVGLMVDGVMEAGAIYEPMHDELYIAQRGQGAWLNGRRMRVSTIADLKASTVEVGWSTRIPLDTYLDMAGKAARAGCSVRRAGSGSLGVAYVAAGRTEAYAEAHINAWDVAAGLLLVAEAGGRINDFLANGGVRSGNPVLVTNAALAQEFSAMTGIGLLP